MAKLPPEISRKLINDWKVIFDKVKGSNDKYIISEYSQTNPRELFAESFVMYRYERNKLPLYIKDFFDNFIKIIK